MAEAKTVLDFWLNAGPKSWFQKNEGFDQQIRRNFGRLHERAAAQELDDWRNAPDGALALILVLDQFSRNMFRDDSKAFAQDTYGLAVAKSSIARNFDAEVDVSLSQFFYMPLMHSESILDQRRCVSLFHAAQKPENLKFAIIHCGIIERFGRFPHRNEVLGRPTSPVERTFLEKGGFSG